MSSAFEPHDAAGARTSSGFPAMAAMTKTELAYLMIRREILEGELKPGTSLDQEALAARLGVSTTPLREALRRLESEQLVINRAHKDTIVAPLSVEALREVYIVRLSLDPLAAGLAATEANDGQIAEMKRSFERHTNLSRAEHLHRNRRVHQAVYRACGNATLIQILDRLWDLSDRYRMITLKKDEVVASAEDEHRTIVEAVISRDVEAARRLMYEHVNQSFEKIRTDAQFGDD